MEQERLATLLAEARSGDLLLFSGKGFISGVVRLFTGSRWSHVGLVMREGEQLLVLESTITDESVDTVLGEAVRGVQVVSLIDKLGAYEGTIALRRLEIDVRPETLDEEIREIASMWRYRGYKDFTVNLLLDLFSPRRRPQRVDRMFCSELVAEVYKRLGVMCRATRSSRYVPGDFGLAETPFLRDARLSAPVFLKG